ncbi:Uma2 family endonuclease [Pleurocapsa sp. PCC 7319]|uniref:Uma2 family endonuclease n=1 Tax=Pleurocapsa sp. PCC 7319 TaxID=118161 RepID=UPI000347650F|nr:Uma2 family endonuclease [Pleurocapsa sp. PCC 7319]
MTLTTHKWSIEEWHDLVDSGVLAGQKVELLEGEIVEMSPEGIPHRNTNHKVVKYLRKLLDGLAEVYESHPITLDNSEPEPDIAIVRLPESIYDTHHPYPEDIYWLIEVSNETLTKDLEQKTTTYARNGISEYWVIDLKNNQLLVHTQPEANNYSQIVEYKAGTISPLAFPQITIGLERLLLY